MKLSPDQVKKVAKLANLSINDSDIEKYAKKLTAILDYVDQLKKVDTEKVDPTYNVSEKKTILREDEAGKSLSQDEALANASQKERGFFKTKGVFSDE